MSTEASWEKFLNPDSLKSNLISAGVFLYAYEMFKQSIVGYPKEMYWEGFDGTEMQYSEKYKSEVTDNTKKLIEKSCEWWKKRGVLSDEDIVKVDEIRTHRNEIAHELPKIVGTAESKIQIDLLADMARIVKKTDQWWILQVEIPTNPDFDECELTEKEKSEVMSMRMIILDLMIPLSQGDDTKMRYIYEGWKRAINQRSS